MEGHLMPIVADIPEEKFFFFFLISMETPPKTEAHMQGPVGKITTRLTKEVATYQNSWCFIRIKVLYLDDRYFSLNYGIYYYYYYYGIWEYLQKVECFVVVSEQEYLWAGRDDPLIRCLQKHSFKLVTQLQVLKIKMFSKVIGQLNTFK